MTVTVGSPNNPPTANNDSYTVAEDSAASTFAVLVNDTPLPDTNEGLTIIAVTQPTGGTVTVHAPGNVIFTPTPNFFGTTTFTYTITDGRQGDGHGHGDGDGDGGERSAGRPSTTPSRCPRTRPRCWMVLANDTTAPDGPETLTHHRGDPAGQRHGDQQRQQRALYTPPAEFSGTTSFTYTISDGNGGTATATVTVTVTPVNDPPIANADSYHGGRGQRAPRRSTCWPTTPRLRRRARR